MTEPQWARMNDAPESYDFLRFHSDGTATEGMVRGGVKVYEQDLDAVPDKWGSCERPDGKAPTPVPPDS